MVSQVLPQMAAPIDALSAASSGSSAASLNSLRPADSAYPAYPSYPAPAAPRDRIANLCQHFIRSRNTTGLALLASHNGIPAPLRQYAWPLLLLDHPYVRHPMVSPLPEPEHSGPEPEPEIVPLRQIRADMRRVRKRLEADHPDSQNGGSSTSCATGCAAYPADLPDTVFACMEEAITRFLHKWGLLVPYESGMTWAAVALAEWVPPVYKTNWVLSGRKGALLEDNLVLLQTAEPQLDAEYFRNYRPDMKFHEVYERLLLVLLHAEEAEPKAEVPQSNYNSSEIDGENSERSGNAENRKSAFVNDTGNGNSGNSEYPAGFPNTANSAAPLQPAVPAVPAADVVSFFLYAFQTLLPDLSRYFYEENVLNAAEEEKWLYWWLKWAGARVWDKWDRGRVWDMYFGWRDRVPILRDAEEATETVGTVGVVGNVGVEGVVGVTNKDGASENTENAENAENAENSSRGSSKRSKPRAPTVTCSELFLQPEDCAAIASDPFWSPTGPARVRDSVATLQEGAAPQRAPFAAVPATDVHTEHVFVCLSMLKAKELTLMELDQSEIREYLSRASSWDGRKAVGIPGGAAELTVRRVRSNHHYYKGTTEVEVAEEEGSSPKSVNHPLNSVGSIGSAAGSVESLHALEADAVPVFPKSPTRDIGSILVQAGELWRSWMWTEMAEP